MASQIQILREVLKEPPLICYGKGKSPKDVLVKANNGLEQHNGYTASVWWSVYSFPSAPHCAMIATGLISNIICITGIQNKPKVACTQLNWLFGDFSSPVMHRPVKVNPYPSPSPWDIGDD